MDTVEKNELKREQKLLHPLKDRERVRTEKTESVLTLFRIILKIERLD